MPDVRLIDANAIDINDISCFYSDECRLDDVQDLIDSQPTVDAQPVKRGKWETKGGVHCTCCGWRPTGRICDLFTAYCAGCGAKMDGDAE